MSEASTCVPLVACRAGGIGPGRCFTLRINGKTCSSPLGKLVGGVRRGRLRGQDGRCQRRDRCDLIVGVVDVLQIFNLSPLGTSWQHGKRRWSDLARNELDTMEPLVLRFYPPGARQSLIRFAMLALDQLTPRGGQANNWRSLQRPPSVHTQPRT